MPYDFTYMWNLNRLIDTENKQNRNGLIDTENKLTVARWEGDWGTG